MPPILLHLYGPFAIHTFGVMIALGLIIGLYFLHQDPPLQKLISNQQLANLFQISFIAGIAGGRIWFVITNQSLFSNWIDSFMIWNGGLSILGAIIAIIITLSIYFYRLNLPTLKILDRIALYAPLTYSISRLGCFYAGCCHGKITSLPWSVMYTDPDHLAPLYVHLHPTQIYSCILLLSIFLLLLYFDKNYKHKKPGQIFALFIMLMSFDRFFIDFLRGDQEFIMQSGILSCLSIQQALALCLSIGACIIMTFISIHKK